MEGTSFFRSRGNGRPLALVTAGVSELYSKTAWWVSERTWRRAHLTEKEIERLRQSGA